MNNILEYFYYGFVGLKGERVGFATRGSVWEIPNNKKLREIVEGDDRLMAS